MTNTDIVSQVSTDTGDPDQAVSALGDLSADEQRAAASRAREKVAELAKINPTSPQFSEFARTWGRLGADEMERISDSSSAILRRRVVSLKDANGKAEPLSEHVADKLSTLRHTMTDLDPSAELNPVGWRRMLAPLRPFTKRLERIKDRYESASERLDAIDQSLVSGQSMLAEDSAALEVERERLWEVLNSSRSTLEELGAAKREVSELIAAKRESGDEQAAKALERKALLAINQRINDVQVSVVVGVQAMASMEIIEDNNEELSKSVERARTTTRTALRTGITIAQALAAQHRVVEQVDAVNKQTSDLLASSSKALRERTGEIYRQATSQTVSIESLESSYKDLQATWTELDHYKDQANAQIEAASKKLAQRVSEMKVHVAIGTSASNPRVELGAAPDHDAGSAGSATAGSADDADAEATIIDAESE